MDFVNGLWLVVLGVLGASSLIIARRPDAKDMIAKLAPYQGWMGAVSALWGAWGIISMILSMSLMGDFFIWWVTYMADSVLSLLLGLLLGVGVLKTFIKDPTASGKLDQTITKLAPFQGTLGLAAIGVGIWMVIVGVLFH